MTENISIFGCSRWSRAAKLIRDLLSKVFTNGDTCWSCWFRSGINTLSSHQTVTWPANPKPPTPQHPNRTNPKTLKIQNPKPSKIKNITIIKSPQKNKFKIQTPTAGDGHCGCSDPLALDRAAFRTRRVRPLHHQQVKLTVYLGLVFAVYGLWFTDYS